MRIRPSTLAIAAAVALVFTGLYVAERSLRDFEALGRAADAHGMAARASAFLQERRAALSSLQGIFLDEPVQPNPERFVTLVEVQREHLTNFRWVWAADSAGVLLHLERFERGGVLDAPVGTDLDTIAGPIGRLVAEVRRTRRTGFVSTMAADRLDSVVMLVEPVVLHGQVRGLLGGSIPLERLRQVVLADSTQTVREGLLLVTGPPAAAAGRPAPGADTVLALGGRGAGERSASVVELPGGGQWYLEAYHASGSPVRGKLWAVALAALGALAMGAWHERRQSQRIADRSRELEHLSQELLRANRAKSEFLANVSHELRTPLNAVVGFTELLRDGVYGELSSRQVGPVQRIEASASHLRLLVDQVLDLAKITAGRLEVQREMVELRQVLLDIGTEMEPLFAERGLAFSLNLGAGVPRVRTDPAHLRQILVNLLGNAVKFTTSGNVTVRTRLVTPGPASRAAAGQTLEARALQAVPNPDVAWVAVLVLDTGPGIAAVDHERIFDEFEQVNAGSRGDSEHRGTGLGLPISRRLARLLGGELTVASEPGAGSVFTLWLPVEG